VRLIQAAVLVVVVEGAVAGLEKALPASKRRWGCCKGLSSGGGRRRCGRDGRGQVRIKDRLAVHKDNAAATPSAADALYHLSVLGVKNAAAGTVSSQLARQTCASEALSRERAEHARVTEHACGLVGAGDTDAINALVRQLAG
jgi:hypothetical protein